jgi:hypothetical protein
VPKVLLAVLLGAPGGAHQGRTHRCVLCTGHTPNIRARAAASDCARAHPQSCPLVRMQSQEVNRATVTGVIWSAVGQFARSFVT